MICTLFCSVFPFSSDDALITFCWEKDKNLTGTFSTFSPNLQTHLYLHHLKLNKNQFLLKQPGFHPPSPQKLVINYSYFINFYYNRSFPTACRYALVATYLETRGGPFYLASTIDNLSCLFKYPTSSLWFITYHFICPCNSSASPVSSTLPYMLVLFSALFHFLGSIQ